MVTTEKNLIYAYTEHAQIRGVGVGWGGGELRGIIVFGGEGGGSEDIWGGGGRPIFSGGGRGH